MDRRAVTGWKREGPTYGEGEPDVFISHSSAQGQLAEGLADILEQHGIRCWYAPRDVRASHPYTAEIDRGIGTAKVAVLLLTADAARSPHVRREVRLCEEKHKAIVCMQLEPCNPGILLRPMGKSFVYRFLDWDEFVEADDPLAIELLLVLKECSSDLARRLLQEAKMAEVRHQAAGDLDWKQIFAQARAGLDRRNRLMLGRASDDVDRTPLAVDGVSPNRPSRSDRVIVVHGSTPRHSIDALTARLARLGADCLTLGLDDASAEELAALPPHAVIAILDDAALRSRKLPAVLERFVDRRCLGVLVGEERLPPGVAYLLATEHVLHARERPLADYADEIHAMLQGDPADAACDAPRVRSAQERPAGAAGVVGCGSILMGAAGATLAGVVNWLSAGHHSPVRWGGVAFAVGLASTSAVALEEWIARREGPLFLPAKDRLGRRLSSTVGTSAMAAFVLAVGVVPLNAVLGLSLPYLRTALILGGMILAVAVPVILRDGLRKLAVLEKAHAESDGSSQPPHPR
jgi:hypothetical protein